MAACVGCRSTRPSGARSSAMSGTSRWPSSRSSPASRATSSVWTSTPRRSRDCRARSSYLGALYGLYNTRYVRRVWRGLDSYKDPWPHAREGIFFFSFLYSTRPVNRVVVCIVNFQRIISAVANVSRFIDPWIIWFCWWFFLFFFRFEKFLMLRLFYCVHSGDCKVLLCRVSLDLNGTRAV